MQQTATALALQNQHVERLKDSIETGNATLIGHIASLSHTGMISANRSSSHQTPTSALDKDPNVLRCESTKRTKARTYRLRLPSWLIDCVWEFGVHTSANAWTAQIYTVNVRPWNSCVFDAVRSGDTKAVRRLLESGRLSLRDRVRYSGALNEPDRPDETLLEASSRMTGTQFSISLHY
jgi:hypothetical protein